MHQPRPIYDVVQPAKNMMKTFNEVDSKELLLDTKETAKKIMTDVFQPLNHLREKGADDVKDAQASIKQTKNSLDDTFKSTQDAFDMWLDLRTGLRSSLAQLSRMRKDAAARVGN